MITHNTPSVSLDEVTQRLVEKANVKLITDKLKEGHNVGDLDLANIPYDWICQARFNLCYDAMMSNPSLPNSDKLFQATYLKNALGIFEYRSQKRKQAFRNVDLEKVSRVAGFFRDGIKMTDLPLTEYSFEEIATAKLWALPKNTGVARMILTNVYLSGRETFDRWRYERTRRRQIEENQDDNEDYSCFGGCFLFG